MTTNEIKKKKTQLALSRMLLILIVLVLGIVSVQQSFASPYTPQSTPGTNSTNTTSGNTDTTTNPSNVINVTIDKSSYNYGDTMTISGTSSNYLANTPVTIMIHDPMKVLVAVDQTFLGTDGTYSASITAAGPTWQAAGTYQVKVQYGISYATTVFQFVTSGQTVVAPLPPTSLTSSTVSSTEIDLSWTAPTNTGSSQLYGYKIERNDGSDFNQIQNTQSTSYKDTGLAPNKSYSYRVFAVNQAGTSDPSNVVTSVTLLSVVRTTTPPANEIDIARGAGGSSNVACVSTSTCFYPNPLYVIPGTVVTWNNTDLVMHTITSGHPSDDHPGSLFGSGFLGPIHPVATPHPSTFSFTFTNAGTYDYFDVLHPWMVGQIIVGQDNQSSLQPSLEELLKQRAEDAKKLQELSHQNATALSPSVITPTPQDMQNINQARANQTIAAEVNVGANQSETTSIDSSVSVQTTSNTPDSLNVSVSASNQTGPKVIVFNLNATMINVANLKDLGVMYDGKLLQPAHDMDAILHAKPTDNPSFAIVVTQSGVQVLVLVPHFSMHSITITNMSKVIPAVPEFPFAVVALMVATFSIVLIPKIRHF